MAKLGIPLMGTDPKSWKWVQVGEFGVFRGHQSGPFELNSRVFDEIVRNFKSDGLPVQWDFEHACEQPATEGSIPTTGAPAQGWVHDLDNRGPAGLWALTEWGPKAKEYISKGEYKFCSPAVRFGCKDRVTGQPIGARLTSVALVGNPFLKGMEPLTAKDVGAGTTVLCASIPLAKKRADHLPQKDSDSDESPDGGVGVSLPLPDTRLLPRAARALATGRASLHERVEFLRRCFPSISYTDTLIACDAAAREVRR